MLLPMLRARASLLAALVAMTWAPLAAGTGNAAVRDQSSGWQPKGLPAGLGQTQPEPTAADQVHRGAGSPHLVAERPALPARGQRPVASGSLAQGRLARASNRLGSYGDAEPQLTSITQLGDLRPGDWAYQALASLVDRYGCLAGYTNGSFDGSRAISRFEAAALLNGCLERVSEATDQLGKLLQEFGPELALLRGRIDGLAGRVGAIGASQFAPTTTLSGLAVFVLGGNRFLHSGPVTKASRPLPSGTSLNYDLELALNTSFNGKDLLRTVLRAGDFGATPFGGQPPGLGLAELEAAFESDAGPNILAIDKLFYQWPLAPGLTATVGARVGQDDMLAVWPSAYPADTILNVMTVNGAPAAYNKNLGPGLGLMWQGKHWSFSSNYVASNGASSQPSQGGLGTAGAGASRTVQVAYVGDQWGLAAIYSFLQAGSQGVPGATPYVQRAMGSSLLHPTASTNAIGLGGYWQPRQAGWWPSVSLGLGFNSTTESGGQGAGSLSQSQSWLTAFQWKDAFAKGNALGLAVGAPVFATVLPGGVAADDRSLVMETWYKFQLTDQISLTPAVFYLSRPLGQLTPTGQTLSQLGALLKASFRF